MFHRITISLASAIAFLAAVASCQPAADPVDYDATVAPKNRVADSEDGFTYVSVTAKGEWSIELQYPLEGPSDWAVMDPASGSGNKTDARIRYSQNDADESRTVTLVLFSGGKQVNSAVFTQNGRDPQPSVPDGYDTTTAGWLELPETKAGDGCVFLPHDMEGKKYLNKAQSGVRNWSCYWSYDEHVSYWVAYPHNNALIGSGERTNAWGVFDPLLPSSIQPNLSNTYGGGWTRGHQIPSADRYNEKANRSTFYPTNMTPQEYNFNAGIWASLEGQVRSYAGSSDTTYVVTGCVLEGSTQKSGSNSGFVVKVPSAYYKAILQRSTSSAVGHNGWRAAAWYLPHDSSIANGSYRDYVISVDELEKKLGYDLFVNLPSAVGSKLADEIEADCAWAK